MSVDLGPARILGTEAIGQPGKRRFRLYTQGPAGSAVMWMEKEQLNSLSLALDRAMAQITDGQVLRIEASREQRAQPAPMPADFPRYPTHEFQVGQLTLAYDEQNTMFVLSAVPIEIVLERGVEQDVEILADDEEAITFRFTQQQAQQLSSTIVAVVRSGRPVCPLCGTPLEGGPHACVKQNGHREIIQVERGGEE
jgi:uncharacterized repeat protein (TIGR03847 family)